ncbi:MAG: MarR family transcriptional regulator [Lachnospiraceae bacterium]|nr:MarR family transcriptional regulator [Lachnospiraceae bacterium]
MNIQKLIQDDTMDFSDIPSGYFLIGLLSAFENRFQAMADRAIGEISWKQFFAIVCINRCKEAPTLKELSDIMGSSHQNVKQILNKLESKGFIRFEADETDKRKQRIMLTEVCLKFCSDNDDKSKNIMGRMFKGLSESDLKTTIKTIMDIEDNMKGLV